MNLRNALLLRSRKQERKEYIGSSLVSSRLVAERVFAWSGSDNRGRPFIMRFHLEWQHPECPVMGWYSLQHQSSTKFQSIEHRRSLDGPFYHEFLLLKLTDGAVCRVERTGEGSRADAIRYVGCAAHDLIQWFPKTDHDSSSIKPPSERIAKVDLGREFDILDVLAVCYSIRNTKACRAYTLQRYNCYFLCLIILAVLTRRVACWETNISAMEWDSGLTATYERWRNLSPEQAKEHAILAICAYLEPDNPRPARFIFDILRTHLGSQAEGSARCNEAVRLALWRADWESGLRYGLTESLKADPDLFKDTGYCSQQLKRAAKTDEEDADLAIVSSETLLANQYFKIKAKEITRMNIRRCELFKHLWRLWRIEHPVPFGKLALSRMAGGLTMTFIALSPSRVIADNTYELRLYSQTSFRATMLKQGSLELTCLILDRLQASDTMQTLWDRATDTTNHELCGSAIVRVLDELASTGLLPPSEVSLVLADFLATDENLLIALIASLADPGLSDMLSLLMESLQTKICFALGDTESVNNRTTTEEFQEAYIKCRIAAHAKRVALHQLAAERFVIEDIEEAMREVWKGLPLGFGAVNSAAEDEVTEAYGGMECL
ncbi:hypothetical protein FRC09_005807 [Ceratobasidium sp. 395]|nr:hypothetical protein FRC09_005807 [Ceratobasidium sp. 395]